MGEDQSPPGRVPVEVDPKRGTVISTSTEPTLQEYLNKLGAIEIPEHIRVLLTPYRLITPDGFDLNKAFDNDGSEEGWVRELIGHCEILRRILESRYTKILPKLADIRRILIQVEVLSARQIIGGFEQPGEKPSDLTGPIERVESLLVECESIDRGETDEYGPEVNWNRLDRMMIIARSGSLRFHFATDDMIPYAKAREMVAESDPWLSDDPRAVRVVLDQLKKNLGAVRIDLAHREWERWLSELAPRYQVILKEAWPILENADGPLTENALATQFRARYDSDETGRALIMARKRGFLVNRKKKPQGYFIRDRFPGLIDPSK